MGKIISIDLAMIENPPHSQAASILHPRSAAGPVQATRSTSWGMLTHSILQLPTNIHWNCTYSHTVQSFWSFVWCLSSRTSQWTHAGLCLRNTKPLCVPKHVSPVHPRQINKSTRAPHSPGSHHQPGYTEEASGLNCFTSNKPCFVNLTQKLIRTDLTISWAVSDKNPANVFCLVHCVAGSAGRQFLSLPLPACYWISSTTENLWNQVPNRPNRSKGSRRRRCCHQSILHGH